MSDQLRGWLEFAFTILQAAVLGSWFLSAQVERRRKSREGIGGDDALLIASESLRVERAAQVQRQFDELFRQIREMRGKASDHMGELQKSIGLQTEKVRDVELCLREHEGRIKRLEDHP